LDGTNRHAPGVERVIFAEADAPGASVPTDEGAGLGAAAGNAGTTVGATVEPMGGICAGRDAGSESSVAFAAVVAPVCAVGANVPCGIPSQRNEAGSREAKDRRPPVAGGFACAGSAAGAFPEGSAGVDTTKGESAANGAWLAVSREADELSGPLTDVGCGAEAMETVAAAGAACAPLVAGVAGEGVKTVVCTDAAGALSCRRGASAGIETVTAVALALGAEVCAAASLSAAGAVFEPKACAAS
jgi:hypothetical protein